MEFFCEYTEENKWHSTGNGLLENSLALTGIDTYINAWENNYDLVDLTSINKQLRNYKWLIKQELEF